MRARGGICWLVGLGGLVGGSMELEVGGFWTPEVWYGRQL